VDDTYADVGAASENVDTAGEHDKSRRGSYRNALRARDLRLLFSALSISAIGGWAYNVALYVYVFNETHSSSWLAGASLGRFVPALLFSTYAGVIAERFERRRVLFVVDALSAAYMGAMAAVAAAHGPPLLVIVIASFASVTGSPYLPATTALIPQIVEEDDLAAANGINGAIDNLSILIGPAIGGALLVWFSPSGVMAVNGATFVVSAVMVASLRVRSHPTDVTREGGVLKQMLVGVKAIGTSSTAAILVGFSVLASFVYGTDTVLFTVISDEKLGTGANGFGYLLAAMGAGGIIGATLINRLASSTHLGFIISVGMIVYTAPTATLTVVHSPTLAFIIEVARGAGTIVVDALAITALQRALPQELIARVFGVFFALVLGAISLGALVMPFILHAAGLDATLLLAGFVIPGFVLLGYPKLHVLDRAAGERLAELAPRITVLEGLGIFAAASRPVLERLASNATEVVLTEPGSAVVSEGERADALYVVVEGRLEVLSRGESTFTQRIRVLEAPAYFGEIGVIEHIPRTATVRTLGPCRLLRIDGDEFLAALTESAPSPSLVNGVSGRLARTHPSFRPAGLAEAAAGRSG